MHCLRVEELSFEYQSGTPILNQLSLEIPFGKTVAILGTMALQIDF